MGKTEIILHRLRFSSHALFNGMGHCVLSGFVFIQLQTPPAIGISFVAFLLSFYGVLRNVLFGDGTSLHHLHRVHGDGTIELLNEHSYKRGWQFLIDTRLPEFLPGALGLQARLLIESGLCHSHKLKEDDDERG